MKVLVVLTVALVLSGANAGFLDQFQSTLKGIGETLKNVYAGVAPLLSTAAGKLVDELKTTGSQILAQGAQALLGSLGGQKTTQAVGTRDLDLMGKIQEFIKNGESQVHAVANTIGTLFKGALSKLTGLASQFGNLDILKNPLEVFKKTVDGVVSSHTLLQSSILKQLIEQPAKLLSSAAQNLIGDLSHHKRSGITDLLSNIGQQLAATFKPVIETVNKHITNLGSTLKNAGTALFGAVKPSIDALSGKLTDHVNNLKQVGNELLGHGKDALSALTDAVTDILGQTFHNAQPTIQKAIDTAKQAGKDTIGTLLGGGN
ncbi:hypothetical protein SNE40_000949 [Patella caerulea]|uniref:Uncharacterized protein n=1 Tax=Patella caerulea TaxID=87958 RepID=A0AAN8KD21_PATCE